MIAYGGWQFPNGETHLIDWMKKAGKEVDGRMAYQWKKIEAALEQCRSFRTAVDVGGHIGLWSYYLAKRFEHVHAFEPVEAHLHCYLANMVNVENVDLYGCALGEEAGLVEIETAPTSSGDSRVAIHPKQDGGGPRIPLKTLDSFELVNVDFIKLDCEGFEYFALKGGEETIKRDMPTIIVEQKPGRGQRFGLTETQAVEYLTGLGYRTAAVMSGDYIMVPA